MLVSLAVAGGLLWQPLVKAANPTAVITLTGTVVSRTCTFDETVASVVLDDINPREFTDGSMKKARDVVVGITCGSGVSSVKIVPTGTADAADTTAFKNTGASTGVALRFTNASGSTLLPGGTSSVQVTPSGTAEKTGSYTFKAGYVATAPGAVTGGNFASMVTLNFNYE
jgi:P pilus assembly protein, pilin FimA